MSQCRYRYLVYDEDGNKIFDTFSYWDARAWLHGTNYMVRQDMSGLLPDKIYRV